MLGRDGKASDRVITAPSWRGPYTLHPKPIAHGKPSVEDPFLYRDARGRFHALFHRFAHPNVSAHAFSADGLSWTFGDTTTPYNSSLRGADGEWRDFARRERPHLIFDEHGAPTHLLTGLVVSGHLSVTHAQPIRTARRSTPTQR
jgi:hypothetical protein